MTEKTVETVEILVTGERVSDSNDSRDSSDGRDTSDREDSSDILSLYIPLLIFLVGYYSTATFQPSP